MTATTPRSTRRRRWLITWILMTVAAIGIAGYAVPPYLTGDPGNSTLPLNPDVALHFLSLVAHAVPGGLALIIGPFQFMTTLRARYPKAHRIAGRVYMISVLIGSITAFFAATFSMDGFPAQVAFYLLAVAWLYTLAQAFRHIRRGEVQLHRIWMIRNYALTFAAVSLRIYLVTGIMLRPQFPTLSFEDVYTTAAWTSILVNALIAEYFIIHRTLKPLARRQGLSLSARAESRANSPEVAADA
jgi:uncharacterized membrane protein